MMDKLALTYGLCVQAPLPSTVSALPVSHNFLCYRMHDSVLSET